MAYYLVKAKPGHDLSDLKRQLDGGEIAKMRPFGTALDYSLKNARLDDEWAVWEEEDYCHPPLDMERQAVLDHFFVNLSVEKVMPGEGWKKINPLPGLWQ